MELSNIQIPKINTALSYADLLQLKADSYNKSKGDLKGYDCPECKNKGYIAKIVNGNEVLTECKCLKIRDTLKRIESSGLEELLRTKTFRNYECDDDWQKNLKEGAVRFAQQDSGSIYMGGQSGSGKTHLCTAIIAAMIKKGRNVRYFVWRDDSPTLKAIINDKEYVSKMNEYKRADVLYIDDLFKQKQDSDVIISDADVKLAFELIDYRNRNNKMTLISTEKYLSELVSIDEALGGRIVEMTRGYQFIIPRDPKKNYRLRGIKQ